MSLQLDKVKHGRTSESGINQVSVIGSGLMGSGIAQVIAEAGYPVQLIDISSERLQLALDNITNNLERKQKKGKCSKEHAEQTLQRINGSVVLDSVCQTELVIEAVPEEMNIKKEIFREVDSRVAENTIIASNTSGLSIAALGSVTKQPEKVIGLHFFYPAPVMKLVEVIPSLITSQATYESCVSFIYSIGKEPVKCPDYPGFLVNRILIPMVNEAIYCVMEGSSPEDIDRAMTLGANHKMGPITLADFVGLDVLLATMEGLYEGYSDSKYRPCPLLKKMVESGNLGRKTGRGFYIYEKSGKIIKSAI
ncbi:3-hydroxybutyryl-CoA dehydrogenase [Caldalkalibacillus uzonensis]|uniref:3-hydroxybutyryl-CoA dehydrogenase n=1 Tax=Caldalkalibacillus uzonensis TaxID=353224 RepID=A0ABU0CMI8_9BACI|nr:3-hydroxyacyl-CoA dehydrogenase NAD-binding domain-containing protein [Caldalkalibacillus uzonensis]MDQ0337362.1 3-hydroxybutyryl-CoA dehydrogenase [Caldalkalibacillus uzonensis]